jgi:hypothetical protein
MPEEIQMKALPLKKQGRISSMTFQRCAGF